MQHVIRGIAIVHVSAVFSGNFSIIQLEKEARRVEYVVYMTSQVDSKEQAYGSNKEGGEMVLRTFFLWNLLYCVCQFIGHKTFIRFIYVTAEYLDMSISNRVLTLNFWLRCENSGWLC